MKKSNHIISKYHEFDEESRLFSCKAKSIELLNSLKIFNNSMERNNKIKVLDCSAGTGVYSFILAKEFEYDIVCTDLVPKHIDLISEKKENFCYPSKIHESVLDASDLSCFDDESFDIVLCMGAFYHLVDKKLREHCLSECVRVLKKNGKLFTTYISRSFMLNYFSLKDKVDNDSYNKISKTGTIINSDKFCPFTDIYYTYPDEMEILYRNLDLDVLTHRGIDGVSPLMEETVNNMDNNEFLEYCDYVYDIFNDKNTIGMSNHIMIVGMKESLKGGEENEGQ